MNTLKKAASGGKRTAKGARGREPAVSKYPTMDELEAQFPLALHVADAGAPEPLTQAIHRALELSALSESGQMEPGLVIRSTMRVRDQRFGDRKVRVEYFQDPELKGSVLMRLTPTTPLLRDAAQLAPGALVRTSEAAELLGVSRPYIAKLCDLGVFGPVEKTEGGQRRVPLQAVLAYQEQRREQRQALDDMSASASSAKARAIERQTARDAVAAEGIRWKKASAGASAAAPPAKKTRTTKAGGA